MELLWQQAFSKAHVQLQVLRLQREAQQVRNTTYHHLHYHYQISLIFVNLSTDLIALSPSVLVTSVLVRFMSARALLSDPGADGGAAQAEGAAVQD